ncbi:hypothetical protein V6N13_053509 [Hibiscus sabdariffa]|uniref:Uncharacterized protein n=1 Tax=Hibiscus sabdariffa TaxID=183260 RepID=A0ABR2T7C1_9ROSI
MVEIDEKSKGEASITISQGQDSHSSYGFSSLVKAMQRGNQQDGSNSFRKKVGSMVSTVFCKHNNFTVTVTSHANDEAITKLNNITVKGSEGKTEGGSGKWEEKGG